MLWDKVVGGLAQSAVSCPTLSTGEATKLLSVLKVIVYILCLHIKSYRAQLKGSQPQWIIIVYTFFSLYSLDAISSLSNQTQSLYFSFLRVCSSVYVLCGVFVDDL